MARDGRRHLASILAVATGVCVLLRPAPAETAAKRFPVTEQMVVAAMQGRQLPVDGIQVTLSAPITASASDPVLEIQAVTLANPHSAQVRVACRDRKECLPFYVAATWPSTSEGLVTQAGVSNRPATQPRGISHSTSSHDRLLKTGSAATLLIEDEKVHIRLQVICLQGGSAGDTVRVATTDHKLTYKAEIVAPNLLKGIF